jgi:cytochrome c553
MKSGTSIRSPVFVLGVGALLGMAGTPCHATEGSAPPAREPPPYWAFAVNPPAGALVAPAQPVDSTPRRVPGSAASFTLAQTKDYFDAPDWHPDRHPAMPDIVAHGRPPEVIACGYCHLPNGQGRPENSSVAGLPAGYIIQQLADFRTGKRRSSEPRHFPTATMVARETKASDEDVAAAAQYFSGLKPKRWIRVVETGTVRVTQVQGWMFVVADPPGLEPIGQRIIEMAEVLERTELRDDASGFVAYVPRGSLRKGEKLVRKGGSGRTVQCTLCHGPDLKGLGLVPSIAGRSPSYVVRQLYDIQHGARAGAGTGLMAPVVASLTVADMLAIAAYTASLRP